MHCHCNLPYGLQVYDKFCHEPFYNVIYDCEYSCKVPLIIPEGKCVSYVH